MKICYIADGASIHTQRWLNYFATKEHEVHLICWKIVPGYDSKIYVHMLKRYVPKMWQFSQYISFIYWCYQVRQLVNKIKPDIIDGHFITTYGFIAACAGFHPLVVTAWGSDILIHPKRNILLRFLVKYSLKRADIITCNSDTAKAGLIDLKVSPEKIHKIRNGIDTQQFKPQKKYKSYKDKLGIAAAPLVISIRNLNRIYNVEMLIKAIPLVLRDSPRAIFIIGGEGEQEFYLQNLIKDLGISDSVMFVGRIPHDELPQYLVASNIYVSTSLSDSSSLSLQEAMACELVPVITDLPGNREWISDGENGFIVPINDIQALAKKIIYLINNGEVANRFGKLCRKIVVERADYQREMSKMDNLYNDLIEEQKRTQSG